MSKADFSFSPKDVDGHKNILFSKKRADGIFVMYFEKARLDFQQTKSVARLFLIKYLTMEFHSIKIIF